MMRAETTGQATGQAPPDTHHRTPTGHHRTTPGIPTGHTTGATGQETPPDRISLLSRDPVGGGSGGITRNNPTDHLTAALSHLDLSDLGAIQTDLKRLMAGSHHPAVLKLVVALTDSVVAEIACRQGRTPEPPGDRGPFHHPTTTERSTP